MSPTVSGRTLDCSGERYINQHFQCCVFTNLRDIVACGCTFTDCHFEGKGGTGAFIDNILERCTGWIGNWYLGDPPAVTSPASQS